MPAIGLRFNTEFFKSVAGILKICELLLGTVCVGLSGHYIDSGVIQPSFRYISAELFFFAIVVTFLIGTFCLLLSNVILFGSTNVSPTTYEIFFHLFAAILYLTALIVLVAMIQNYVGGLYRGYMAAGIIGIVVSLAYAISLVFSIMSYRKNNSQHNT